MPLARSRAEKSSFPPLFPLLSKTVISALFPRIRGHSLLASVPKMSPNRPVTFGASPWPL